MAQGFEQNSELDRMKADAIKRARQMHLRAINLPPNVNNEKEKIASNPTKSTYKNNAFSITNFL